MLVEATTAISRPVHQLPLALAFPFFAEANDAISRPVRALNRSSRNTRKQQLHEEKAFLEQPISALSKAELESFLHTKPDVDCMGLHLQLRQINLRQIVRTF